MLLSPEYSPEIAIELENRIAKPEGRVIGSNAPDNNKAPLPRLNAGLGEKLPESNQPCRMQTPACPP